MPRGPDDRGHLLHREATPQPSTVRRSSLIASSFAPSRRSAKRSTQPERGCASWSSGSRGCGRTSTRPSTRSSGRRPRSRSDRGAGRNVNGELVLVGGVPNLVASAPHWWSRDGRRWPRRRRLAGLDTAAASEPDQRSRSRRGAPESEGPGVAIRPSRIRQRTDQKLQHDIAHPCSTELVQTSCAGGSMRANARGGAPTSGPSGHPKREVGLSVSVACSIFFRNSSGLSPGGPLCSGSVVVHVG